MYKIFTLAAAVAIFPLYQNISPSIFTEVKKKESLSRGFLYSIKKEKDPFVATAPGTAWSQDWKATAYENIRKSEYNFTWEKRYNAYCTPNRKNNLRFFYKEDGFSVEPRTTQIPIDNIDPVQMPVEIRYRSIPYWKINIGLDKNQVGKGSWEISNNRAAYLTDKITVQYINNDEGMRQNFIVRAPLSNSDELKINLSVKTTLKVYLHNDQLQFFHKKINVLNYEQLKVWDATGRPLKASIKKNKKNRFYIQVNAKNAVYPITVDPLSTTPNSTLDDANQLNAGFGRSVASAGDVNGDGYSDVIIGAWFYDVGANTDEGKAFVYHGSATGLSATPNSTPDDANQAGASFGVSVASAGDVNGDGYSDVIIGAYQYDDGANAGEGRAYIYHGSAAGLAATPASTPDDANQAGAAFGFSVAGAGDINGDGYSDVVIGAYLCDDAAVVDEGKVFVYNGSATGLSATPASTPDDANQASARFGMSVASAGDINGDGYSDVIIGASLYDDGANASEGRAFVYHGSATGLSAMPASTPDDANQANANFGRSVACAGDVNGDGYSDVIIGAPDDDIGTEDGQVFIYHGSATGLPASPNKTLNVNQGGELFGICVACAGDINGDGYSDVIISAVKWDEGAATDIGAAFIYQGSSTGLPTAATTRLVDVSQFNASFSNAVASAGDVNGDGYSDVIVGAYQYDDGSNVNEGRAFVYHGSSAGLSATPNSTPDDANQANANFGIAVASAGDINADGYSDVIIGAHLYDDGANTDEGRAFIYHGSATGLPATPSSTPDDADQANAWFGYAVAGAGDVNGDGYGDVIIGAYKYDDGANADEGRAFVYHGSATGLSAAPGSVLDDADQANANFGISVSCAGDVNRDGYSDVIIGAYQFNDGANGAEGRAFVYYGSAAGLPASPNSTPDDADQQLAFFGSYVAAAGDVNGDGFGDVIIGAYQFNDGANAKEGRAFVYHGSATGLSASPASLLDDANQANAYFGISVAGAGDVNSDGYNDVIVGAYLYDDGANVDEGRAFVYHGSATGLSATPNSTLDDANQAGASFGRSVACAGDINGDGYSDVITGAMSYTDGANTNEGRSFVYRGSSTGLSASPTDIQDDANQGGAGFALAAAGAGDINGDGYSDIIIGANSYDDGANTNEGRTFIYNGNELTANQRNNIRLYNSDLTTPINKSNVIIANFGAGLFARSFLGRNKGKLVWQTRASYAAYSGSPITNSTAYTNQQAAYSNLGLSGSELKAVITKVGSAGIVTKLRARVKYDPATAITGQVYGPWRYVSSIIDGNKLGALLPAELLSFKAAWLQKGRTAKINFTTDKENGICCFDIEKSTDGFNYSSIATIPARNVSGIQSYSFTDNNAVGKSQYYRLKIKGMQGQIEYSSIQHLQYDRVTDIFIFPNPTTDMLQLSLNNNYGKVNVQIINSAGQLVRQMNNAVATDQILKIPVSHLRPGNYWIRLQSGSELQTLQFIKK